MQKKFFVVNGDLRGVLGDHLAHDLLPAVNDFLIGKLSGETGALQEGADGVFDGLFVGRQVNWLNGVNELIE